MNRTPSDLLARHAPQPTMGLDHLLDDPRLKTPESHSATTRGMAGRWVRRGVLLAGAAAALTVAVSVSGVFGGGTAYATWTATPTVLPADQEAKVVLACRDTFTRGSDAERENYRDLAAGVTTADLILTDTRGDWTFVVLSDNESGVEASCLVEKLDEDLLPEFAASGGASFGNPRRAPQPDQILGVGVSTAAGDDGIYWTTHGTVGSNVAAVTVVSADGLRIEATVQNGWFAAWWPSRYTGTESGRDLPEGMRWIVTLTDGTVLDPIDHHTMFSR